MKRDKYQNAVEWKIQGRKENLNMVNWFLQVW